MENLILDEYCLKNFKHDIQENKVAHAYLIISQDDMFNEMISLTMASILLCDYNSVCGDCSSCIKILAETHPDLLRFPQNKNFLVQDAEAVVNKAFETPTLGDIKVIILNNIDKATVQAQNKILKTLEEPSKSTVFILTAENENKILPTVVSRARKEFLKPLDAEKIKSLIEIPPALYKNILPQKRNYIGNELSQAISFGEGFIGKTVNALNSTSFGELSKIAKKIANSFSSSKKMSEISYNILLFKEDIKNFLELLESEFRKLLLISKEENEMKGYCEIIEAINYSFAELNRNVSQNLIVDNLLMKILENKYIYKLGEL